MFHITCAVAINITLYIVDYEKNSMELSSWTYCQTTEGMKLILREMARDSSHSIQSGYGPLLPDKNVFRNTLVYRAAVHKAFL